MLGPSRITALPDIPKSDVPDDGDDAEQQFFMYIFKVQPCPKRGAHDWSSCPYAHPKEKARRRDPRVYKYASTPCPESLKGVSCGRGVDCPYAHSVYEYWLHPSRFRTQMCKKGNQCNRTLCFFAHSASELRFPDTADDFEAAVADAAAASATAGALPLISGTPAGSSSALTPSGVIMAGGSFASNGGSGFGLPGIVGLNSMCSDASMQLAGSCAGGSGSFGGSSSFGLMPGQQQLQGQRAVEEVVGGSDSSMRMAGIAVQPSDPASISDPLPRLADPNARVACNPGSAAWLQLAAASQLPASQILSSIRPPGAQQQLQQPQQRIALMHAAAAPPPSMLLNGGAGSSNATQMGTVERLSSGFGSISLVDDNSASSCLTAMSGDQQYLATLNACAAAAAAGRPIDLSVLQQPVASPPKNSSNIDNFMLLQQLQQQQQQQQLVKLGSGASAISGQITAGSRQNSANMYVSMGGVGASNASAGHLMGSWNTHMG